MARIATGSEFELAINKMIEYVETIKPRIEAVFEEFHQLAAVEHPWEVLYNTALSLETMYNEEVLGKIKQEIESWAEGDGSYVRLTERFKMGEDATSFAKLQQDNIMEAINTMPEITVISENKPNFAETNFDPEVVKTELEAIATKTQNLNEVAEEKNSELERLSEENESIRTIVNVGITYGTSIANFVTKVTEKINQILAGELDSMVQEQNAAVEEAKQAAEKFSQSMEDTVSSIDSFLADIFA